jgi:hypothetical protein
MVEGRWYQGRVTCAVRRGEEENEQQAAQAKIKIEGNPEEVTNALSEYYIETEGILLTEFGSFLGTLADRIDDQLKRPSDEKI